MNRIAIAQAFVQKQIQSRPDLIAAWVGGSVARGEDTETSDIDLGLMVEHAADVGINRAGVDAWQEGIYIESAVVGKNEYADLDIVSQDPVKATHLYDALILYDPTGFLAQMQQAVRALYMTEKWLQKRLAYWIEAGQADMARLRQGIAHEDPLNICAASGGAVYSFIAIVLLHQGITPSSSRGIVQLGSVANWAKEKIHELQGASNKTAAEAQSLFALLDESVSIIRQSNTALGQLPEYFRKKIKWMTQTGLHREAVQPLWLIMSTVAEIAQANEDEAIRTRGLTLVQEWLHWVGWDEPLTLAIKLQLAEALFAEIQRLTTTPLVMEADGVQ